MAWIRTVPLEEASAKLRQALEDQKLLYPKEYATPVHPSPGGRIVGDRRLAQLDSRGAIPCFRNLRRPHVARLAANATSPTK